jgi:hypothetical protein
MNITKSILDGVLQPCKCHVNKRKLAPLGLYNPSFKNGKIIGHIWITYYVDWTEEDLREDTIVHEMIHHYTQTIEGHRGGLFVIIGGLRDNAKGLRKSMA